MIKLSTRRGFTLIELLVVIAIISILSTLLMANFVGIRQRGRDAQRKSDLRQIQTALEMYRSDNGSYPTVLSDCGSSFISLDGITTYMSKIPCDPSDDSSFAYSTTDNGVTYSITACLENSSDSEAGASPCGGKIDRYTFTLNNP